MFMYRLEKKPKRPIIIVDVQTTPWNAHLWIKCCQSNFKLLNFTQIKGVFMLDILSLDFVFYTHCYSLSQILTEREQYVM